MSRTSLLVRFAAACLGIVAIALAAATVSSPVETGDAEGIGFMGDGSFGYSPPPEQQPAPDLFVPAFLEYLLGALVILVALSLAWYLITHRRELVQVLAICFLIGLFVLVVWYALERIDLAGLADAVPRVPTADNETGLGGGGEDEVTAPFSVEPLLTILAIVTAIFVGALLFAGNDDAGGTSAVSADREESRTEPAPAIGAAAGRAIDRISDGDSVDNEVYRAWLEMTRPLEVERPDASTPGEFATAAMEAGLDREYVEELTRLFEDVRYGNEETTTAMERRALSILREIEAEYADDQRGDDE